MEDYMSINNVPISLEERICRNKAKCVIYINSFSWIVDIGGYYEFYFTPRHFIGKILKVQMPQIVVNRIKKGYKAIKGSQISYRRTNAHLRESTNRLQQMEYKMNIGNWYHAQGQNYFTFDDIFVCDDMYVANLERECPLSEIDGPIIFDMLRMGCQTKSAHFIQGIFDFPIFNEINTGEIEIYSFEDLKWNASLWSEKFNSILNNDTQAKNAIHEMRSDVFQHTINLVKQGKYTTNEGVEITFPLKEEIEQHTKFYTDEVSILEINSKQYKTEIHVANIDCLTLAKQMIDQGYNVAVLNMANRQTPGGGVYDGAGAQEENLFRRTDLFRSLYQFAPYANSYGIQQSINQYPLDRNFGGIYSPNIMIFRSSESLGYKLLDEPFIVPIISVAGMNRPELDNNGSIVDYLIEPIKNKIRTIFRIGLLNGHDSIVLGALGCGAFRNPPKQIAFLFHQVIEEEFKNRFKCLYFAILEDHNSHLKHNIEGNLKPFCDEFSNWEN